MTTETQIEKARAYYKAKKYPQSLELFEEIIESGHELDLIDKERYAWDLYFVNIKENSNIKEIEESAKKIIENVNQKNSSMVNKPCPYTLSVIKIMKHYYENDNWVNVLRWASKLKPEYLSNQHFKPNADVTYNSNKENWYLQTTKSLLNLEKYDQTLDYCLKALDNIPNFNNNNDIWFKLRIAQSYKELGEYDKSIEYLNDILKFKKDWYLYRDMAENYFFKEEYDESLKWAARGALARDGKIESKVNLFALIGDILEIKGYEDESVLTKYLVYTIRNAKEWNIDDDLVELIDKYELDLENKDFKSVYDELENMFLGLKFFGQERQYGKISKVFDNKSGFIKSNGTSYYFNSNEFKDDKDFIYEGTEVSFFLEPGYDKKKDKEVMNAVNIYCEMI